MTFKDQASSLDSLRCWTGLSITFLCASSFFRSLNQPLKFLLWTAQVCRGHLQRLGAIRGDSLSFTSFCWPALASSESDSPSSICPVAAPFSAPCSLQHYLLYYCWQLDQFARRRTWYRFRHWDRQCAARIRNSTIDHRKRPFHFCSACWTVHAAPRNVSIGYSPLSFDWKI